MTLREYIDTATGMQITEVLDPEETAQVKNDLEDSIRIVAIDGNDQAIIAGSTLYIDTSTNHLIENIDDWKEKLIANGFPESSIIEQA